MFSIGVVSIGRRGVALAVIAAAGFLGPPASRAEDGAAAVGSPGDPMGAAAGAIQQEIQDRSQAGDVAGLGGLAEALRRTYWAETLEICERITSMRFGQTPAGLKVAHEYALSALDQGEQMPVWTEAEFLECLTQDGGVAKPGADWAKLRARKAVMYLRVWQRIDQAIDRHFDFSQRLYLNVEPPPGSGIPAGADPAAVADPRLRREYEAAIQANKERFRVYIEQRWLYELDRLYRPHAEKYLVYAYSMPPLDTERLTALLNQYIDDQAVRARILKSVAQRATAK